MICYIAAIRSSPSGLPGCPAGAACREKNAAWRPTLDTMQVMGAIAQSSPVARKLFQTAYESKRAALRRGDLSGGRFGPLWDRLVFSKVRARLGGQPGSRAHHLNAD